MILCSSCKGYYVKFIYKYAMKILRHLNSITTHAGDDGDFTNQTCFPSSSGRSARPAPPPSPLSCGRGGGDCGHKTACEPARWGPNIQNLHFISILVKFIAATVPSIVPFTSVGRALSGSTWKPKTFKGESVYFHNITYQLHFKTTMLFPERNICPLAPFFMKYFILLYLRVSQWVLCKSRWRFLYDEGQPHY